MAQFTPTGVERTVRDSGLYEAFPEVCALPDGTLVAVWRRSTIHAEDTTASVVSARSTDGGTTWSATVTVSDTAALDDVSCGVVSFPDGEVVAQVMTRDAAGGSKTTYIVRSLDGGLTWGAKEPGVNAAKNFAAGLVHHDDGTPGGILYATHYVGGAGIARSTDRGLSWEPQRTIATNGTRIWQEPQIAALGQGALVCMLRSYRASDGLDDALYLSRSYDGGTTWTAPVRKIAGASGMPTMYAAPDGTLLLIYRDPPLPTAGWGWASSLDSGETWTIRDASVFGAAKMMYGGWAALPATGNVVCVYARETAAGNCDVHAQVFVTDTPPAPDPGTPVAFPTPAPVAIAVPRSHVTWLSCDLVTGGIIAELPELHGQVSRVLGAATSTSLTLPIPRSGPGAIGQEAFDATVPGPTLLVAVVNDVPTWGGIILVRKGGTGAALELGTVSLEGYLDRRYARDHTWAQADQCSVIAAGLLEDANVDGVGLVIDAPSGGVLRDRTYLDTDDVRVYSRLTELASVLGGIEWTIDLDWADASQTRVAKIARVRTRIGTEAVNAVFSSVGPSEATYTFTEDYSDGRGANDVMATGSGEGDSRPASAHYTNVLPGWPTYERRFTPSSAISKVSVLDAHAAADLALRVHGGKVWEIETRWDASPRLNVDWALGDDVAWELRGHRHPDGIAGQGRAVGWTLDLQRATVVPILWEPDSEGAL